MARKMGRRYFQMKSGSVFSSLSRCTELTISWSSLSGSSPPIFCSTSRASSTRFLRNQPARALRDAKQHYQKQHSRQGGDSELPAPFHCAETLARDYEIRQIGEQDANDDVDLKHADQAAADSCWGQFRDVHRTQHRRASNAQAAEKTRQQQSVPAPRESAAQRGEHVEDGQHAQRFSDRKSTLLNSSHSQISYA